MALVLPYPNTPQNGQTGDATPINANFTAIAQAIQSFDGSQIAAGSIVSSALNSTINPVTRDNLIVPNFVSSGCIWTTVSGLTATMSSGVLFINGIMVTVNGVSSNTFVANNDTYIDIDYNGNVYYNAVSNNAASPNITANAIRVAICVAGSSITSWNQGSTSVTAPIVNSNILAVSDALGNLIYPTRNQKIIGYRYVTSPQPTASTTAVDIPGLNVCTVNIPTGAKIIVTFGSQYVSNSGAAGVGYNFSMVDSTASTEVFHSTATTTGTNYAMNGNFASPPITPPTSGVRTYKMQFYTASSTLTVQASASNPVAPAFVKVEID